MKILKINEKDNVAVALEKLVPDQKINTFDIAVNDEIPAGHKIALADIPKGSAVIKYGAIIGNAFFDIKAGSHVHSHNLHTALSGKNEYEYNPACISGGNKTVDSVFFKGFRRGGGRIGVRNEIWIIPTVGCVNGTVKAVEKLGQKFKEGNIDEITAFTHPYGCSQLGDDQESTRKILANLIRHPNAGGVIVVGLGCENSGISVLKDYLGSYNPDRIKFLQTQDVEDETEYCLKLLEELSATVSEDKREDISVSELVIGLKCGGSDGFSGITANPVVGVFSDLLVSSGGTAILTEVPEMFGAEHILMSRAVNVNVFNETVSLINDFKDYYIKNNAPVYENPSPGNKDGGITTLEEKSLGCTQKSGMSPVNGVIGYGGTVREKGLNLLSSPGNDLVAATALAAAGAHIVLFTTGRGTPFASPVPTVKISSNTELYNKKSNWIDFDAGGAVNGKTMDELGKALFDFVIETASGKLLKSEKTGFRDMAVFKTGVTL